MLHSIDNTYVKRGDESMNVPEKWGSDVWARAAAPAMPRVHIGRFHITSDATPHAAMYSGNGWTVDYLPGRTLDLQQAKAAVCIAAAPGRELDVKNWASQLGLTALDAIGYLEMGAPQIEQDTEAGVAL